MPDRKTVATSANAAGFVATIVDHQQRADSETLLNLLASITGEPPVMWGPSIVGFGSSHYRYPSGREGDTFVIGFSPRKHALSLYIGGLEQHQGQLAQLGPHSVGKGCLYIQRLSDVDLSVVRRLLESAASQRRR